MERKQKILSELLECGLDPALYCTWAGASGLCEDMWECQCTKEPCVGFDPKPYVWEAIRERKWNNTLRYNLLRNGYNVCELCNVVCEKQKAPYGCKAFSPSSTAYDLA